MSKKKTIEFVFIKEGEETVKLLAGKLVTRFKQDHQLKPDECRAMLDIIANDGELDLPEDMKSTDKKYMKLMFTKLAAIVKDSAKLGEALVAKEEKEKLAIVKRGEVLTMATAKGYAKNELLVEAALGDLQKVVGKKFTVGACGLTLADGAVPTEAEFADVIATLAAGTEGMASIANTLTWNLGDALMLAKTSLGEDVANQVIEQVVETTGRQKHTVIDAIRVASKFTAEKRHPELSFTHHQEIANYEGKIKAPELKKIVATTIKGEEREIVQADGKKVKQSRPLSCRKMRDLLQEAAGIDPKKEKAAKAKVVEEKEKDEEGDGEGAQSTEQKASSGYLIIDEDSNVYQSAGITPGVVGNAKIAIVIDLDSMTLVALKSGKIIEGEPISQLPDEFLDAAPATPAKKAAPAKKEAKPKTKVPDIDGAPAGSEVPDL